MATADVFDILHGWKLELKITFIYSAIGSIKAWCITPASKPSMTSWSVVSPILSLETTSSN